MKEHVEQYLQWWDADQPFALTTIIEVRKSAPLPAGTTMAVGPAPDHRPDRAHMVVGSVSGGCVEGAVYEVAEVILTETGKPQLEFFGYSDDTAFANGLSCGGELEIFVERIDHVTFPAFGRVAHAIRNGQPVAIATVVEGDLVGDHLVVFPEGEKLGGTGDHVLDSFITETATSMLVDGMTGCVRMSNPELQHTSFRVFVQSFAPPPRMLIFGAIDFAAALTDAAKLLGYKVTVCDARPIFATDLRFPNADEVIVQWPHRYLQAQYDSGSIDRRTVACVLTHDVKFDVPLLLTALDLPLAYVGAMGSRKTHAERQQLLLDEGIDPLRLNTLRSPIGLNLGATNAAETAVSIVAEIISARNNRSGVPLSHTTEAIHPPSTDTTEFRSLPLPEGSCHD